MVADLLEASKSMRFRVLIRSCRIVTLTGRKTEKSFDGSSRRLSMLCSWIVLTITRFLLKSETPGIHCRMRLLLACVPVSDLRPSYHIFWITFGHCSD